MALGCCSAFSGLILRWYFLKVNNKIHSLFTENFQIGMCMPYLSSAMVSGMTGRSHTIKIPKVRLFIPSFLPSHGFVFSDSHCNLFHHWPFEVQSDFSPFKLKTILFDLEFQNQSFMVWIHVIWHFSWTCSVLDFSLYSYGSAKICWCKNTIIERYMESFFKDFFFPLFLDFPLKCIFWKSQLNTSEL